MGDSFLFTNLEGVGVNEEVKNSLENILIRLFESMGLNLTPVSSGKKMKKAKKKKSSKGNIQLANLVAVVDYKKEILRILSRL